MSYKTPPKKIKKVLDRLLNPCYNKSTKGKEIEADDGKRTAEADLM